MPFPGSREREEEWARKSMSPQERLQYEAQSSAARAGWQQVAEARDLQTAIKQLGAKIDRNTQVMEQLLDGVAQLRSDLGNQNTAPKS